jgi:hypothetical protein
MHPSTSTASLPSASLPLWASAPRKAEHKKRRSLPLTSIITPSPVNHTHRHTDTHMQTHTHRHTHTQTHIKITWRCTFTARRGAPPCRSRHRRTDDGQAQTHGLRREAVEKGEEVGGVQGGLQLWKPGSSQSTWLRLARHTHARYAALPTQDADLVATAASGAWRGAAGIAPCPASVQRSRAEPARVSYARTHARTHSG